MSAVESRRDGGVGGRVGIAHDAVEFGFTCRFLPFDNGGGGRDDLAMHSSTGKGSGVKDVTGSPFDCDSVGVPDLDFKCILGT